MVEIVPARPTVMAALPLKRRFNSAPVIVVELEDWELPSPTMDDLIAAFLHESMDQSQRVRERRAD
jgi:hypothetical protein